eukprot:Skav206083  [mRNA]  locus=scaffold2150:42701:43909:+ [translate_table: standard]
MCQSTKLQSIYRAELEALVFVTEQFSRTHTYSDSQAALNMTKRITDLQDPSQLQGHPEADLATRLWNAMQRGERSFDKVKAHSLDEPDITLLEKYHRIGNHIADRTAAKAMSHQHKHITDTSNTLHENFAKVKKHLNLYYQMLLQMFKHRASIENSEQETPNRAEQCQIHADYVESLCQLCHEQPWIPLPLQADQTYAAAWGATLNEALVEWMAEVSWPDQPIEAAPYNVGVTWIELAISFVLTTGVLIPVKRLHPNGKSYLVLCESMAHVEAIDLRLAELGDTFQKWITQILGLQIPPQWPDQKKGLVRSLYTLGSSFQSSGFLCRPSFPNQRKVVHLFKEYLLNHEGTSYETLPSLDLHASEELHGMIKAELIQDWDSKCRERQEVARAMKRHHARGHRA